MKTLRIISAVAALLFLAGALIVSSNIAELAKISEHFRMLGATLAGSTLFSTALYCMTDLALDKMRN